MGTIFQKIFAVTVQLLRLLLAIIPAVLGMLLKALFIPYQLLAASVGHFWAIVIYLIILSSITGGLSQSM